MDTENIVCVHSGILFSHKKMMSFAGKMDATGDYPIKWNESASERQTAYVFPHLWILNFMEIHDSSLGGYGKGWKRDFPKE